MQLELTFALAFTETLMLADDARSMAKALFVVAFASPGQQNDHRKEGTWSRD